MQIKKRTVLVEPKGWDSSIPYLIQQLYAARGATDPSEIQYALSGILHPAQLGGIEQAATVIADAIIKGEAITVAGDYDCDGATGSSVLMRALRLLGATEPRFALPNRFKHGYGLSPALVESMQPKPDLIVTVDSGVSSLEGVRRAHELGIRVVITDHHLPGETLPDAEAIVNPNLKDDPFPSKALAGVGVAFYVMLFTKKVLTDKGWWSESRPAPDLSVLLDLVAIGTIADLVKLDRNNRILVTAGLNRIRSGRSTPGIYSLIERAKCDPTRLTSQDIAFNVAPRLNAAGRLEDMTVGVQALIEDDDVKADKFTESLEKINDERKTRQAEMIKEAEELTMSMATESGSSMGVTVYDPGWHSGIVGLVASRLKESLHRPVVALAPAEPGSTELRGSCRSIDGFHLRDALAIVDARNPGLLSKFGGHAAAAGLSMHIDNVEKFRTEFDKVAAELITEEMLAVTIVVDGELPVGMFTLDTVDMIAHFGPWGQAFPEPMFLNRFYVNDYRIMGEKHLKLFLVDPRDGTQVDAVFFNGVGKCTPEGYVQIAFELKANSWNGRRTLQLIVRSMVSDEEAIEPPSDLPGLF